MIEQANEIVERDDLKRWREFACCHINDEGMTGAEIEALTRATSHKYEESDCVVDRIRQIAVNHQLVEVWML
jgi:hypothetical protein